MDFSLTDDQKQLRQQIIEFCRKELNDGTGERDQRHEFPRQLFKRCGEMGLTGLCVSPEHGGVGLDPLSTALALEAFGYGCRDGGLVFSVCAHLLACVIPVWKYGSTAQKDHWLPLLATGERVAVNAMSEPGTGSDAFAMTTRAEADRDGFRIRGTKTFSSNGPVADVAVLYAVTDPGKGYHGGISTFLVPMDTKGVSRGQTFTKMGLHTAPIGELVIDDAWVPRDALLGELGAGGNMFQQSMEWERICLPAAHVGTMQWLLETAVRYARTRNAFGKSIGKFQAVSHRIVEMKVRLEAARLMTYRAASRLERSRDVGQEASMTKLFVSESLVESALDAVKVLGGYGYMQEYEVERALRDGIAGMLYSGTNDIQRNIVASWLGL